MRPMSVDSVNRSPGLAGIQTESGNVILKESTLPLSSIASKSISIAANLIRTVIHETSPTKLVANVEDENYMQNPTFLPIIRSSHGKNSKFYGIGPYWLHDSKHPSTACSPDIVARIISDPS